MANLYLGRNNWHAPCLSQNSEVRGRVPMDRDQLIQRLRARARRGGPAEQVWWNGELVHVSEAIMRAVDLTASDLIRARGDDVVIPRTLRDD